MFKSQSLQATARILSQPSALRSGRAGASFAVRAARAALALVVLTVGAGLSGGCSDNLDCTPAMPAGAVYKATLGTETEGSSKCHIVAAMRMSPFNVTVGSSEPTASRRDCSVTPAASAPQQLDVQVLNCVPGEEGMLGVYCQIIYKAGCDGHMQFYFTAKDPVNWSAPVIDNVLFRIQDFSPNCFSDQSNCLDEYTARLERIQ
ncbi:MAG TPA: hypothetical protein VG937_25375 [Polyangiaceae bacterium]|nr:hypothetical protein [Polyangiaceae bacterium]